MKVELHLHTSRFSSCATAEPEDILAHCVQEGYDVVYITEHNAVWPEHDLQTLRAKFPQIRIFGGVELTVSYEPCQHLLVLGHSDREYLAIAQRPDEVLLKARREGHLTILAHPVRYTLDQPILDAPPRPEAIEYLSCNQMTEELSGMAAAIASRYRMKLVNAGDVHAGHFLGRYWIETTRPVEQAGDIRQIVLDGAYERRTGPPFEG